VKAVMRRIIAESERRFVERLERLPDGEWRACGFLEQALPGDKGVYRLELGVEKSGAHLTFTNTGTDPQVGGLNCTVAGWRSSVMNAVSLTFCYDLLCAIGGPLRHITLDATPGTLCTADYPGAVGNSTNYVMMLCVGLGTEVLGRMIVSDEAQRRQILTRSGASTAPISGMSGINQHGDPWAGIHMEIPAGGIGAFSHKDGIPTGGVLWSFGTRMPDAESEEAERPLLFLYRRQLRDSAGAGRWTRGVGIVAAQVAHRTEGIRQDIAACGVAVPSSAGMFGGYPGVTNRIVTKRDTNIHDLFRDQIIPQSLDEIEGTLDMLQPKTMGATQRPGDVHEFRLCAGAGYGDPLLREPDRVAEDVQLGYLEPATAESFYGVVVNDGEVDTSATERMRLQLRRDRLNGRDPLPVSETDGFRIGEYLVATAGSPLGASMASCRMCRTEICQTSENPKEFLVREDSALAAAGSLFEDEGRFIDEPVQFRRFYCPGCATLVESEIARKRDPVMWSSRPRVD
jgi:N-methylhydantoinase B